MPFAEWLYRMAEAGVPAQARSLAIYAALFQITSNTELAWLCGMVTHDKQGNEIASRTFDKWKAQLALDGFVIVERHGGGRGHGLIIHPAYDKTSVTFTDVSQRNPRKFYPRNNCQTPAAITPVSFDKPPQKATQTPAKLAAQAVAAKEKSPHTPLKENNLPSQTVEQEAAGVRACENEIPGLNGATSLFVRDLATWLNPYVPDLDFARKQVGEAVRIYGDIAVRDGFAEMKADIADGKIRVPNVKQIFAYFRQAKDRPKQARGGLNPPTRTFRR